MKIKTPEWSPAAIKDARRRLGVTQEQLADKQKIKLRTIRSWEQGVKPRSAFTRRMMLTELFCMISAEISEESAYEWAETDHEA